MRKQQQNKQRVVREQDRKDSKTKRVNFDNTRIDKFKKDMDLKGKRDIKQCSTDNDIKWYSRNPELLQAAARFPFYNVTGQKLPLTYKASLEVVPGVMVLDYVPSLGPATSKALKQAQDSMQSYVVHANSRNESYDGADLMMLVLAGVEVFSAIAAGIRAYGLMRLYQEENAYMPSMLIQGSGFSPSDLKAKYSQMYYDLNRLIAASKQIWVPNTMPLMERRFWMNTNVYQDAETIKGQFYLFKQAKYYKYKYDESTTGGGLVPTTIQFGMGTKWLDYVAMVDEMIEALVNDSDRGVIFGDILKAYGSEALYTINEMPIDYQTPISYNREVLTQIENATFCPSNAPTSFTQLTDGTIHAVYSGETITSVLKGAPDVALLNFHQKEAPTPEQIVIATRLTAVGTVWTLGNGGVIIGASPVVMGTEYINQIRIYYNQWNPSTNTYGMNFLDYVHSNVNGPITKASLLWLKECFDWCPALYCDANTNTTISGSSLAQFEANRIFSDYENYTFLQNSDLERIHTMAVFSEFGVPIDRSEERV